MATVQSARKRLSQDLGDEFNSTTTATAGAPNQLKDDRLKDYDDDRFVTRQSTIWIAGGQTGGPANDEERGINTKSSDVLTTFRNFSVTLPANINYEVHRLFSASEKDSAISVALDLCFPILWARVQTDITMVAEQYDYNISSAGFYNNTPHQVHIVSNQDTELTIPLHAYDIRENDKLHLLFRPLDGRKLRLFGIRKATLAEVNEPQLGILTARAAMFLLEQAITQVPTDLVGRFNQLLALNASRFAERVSRHMIPGPSRSYQTEVWNTGLRDTNWRIP